MVFLVQEKGCKNIYCKLSKIPNSIKPPTPAISPPPQSQHLVVEWQYSQQPIGKASNRNPLINQPRGSQMNHQQALSARGIKIICYGQLDRLGQSLWLLVYFFNLSDPIIQSLISISIQHQYQQYILFIIPKIPKNKPQMPSEQQPEQQQIGLDNSQSWVYIWKKLKNSVFDVLFVLLDNSEDEESMFGLIFQTGVDYVQMMAFPFNSVVLGVWNANDTLNGVTNFFNNFNVSTYIPGVGFDTFLVLLYSLIFLILVVISDIVYVAYSFSKKRFRFTFPLIFMAKVVPLFVTVLFLPIMQTLLQVVNCQTSQDGSHQVLQSFPNIVCWQGWHLFHTTITLLFSLIFVFISCIVALALFQPRMTTNRLTARQNSTGEVVFIINKIICQFIFSFSPFEGSLPYCLLLFGLSSWLFSTYNVAQPYYDKRASKFFRICSSYYFWTNLMLLVSQLLMPIGFQDGLVIWICGMIFIGITIVFQRKSNIDTLFASSLKFKSGLQLQSHLKYVLQLHHNKSQDKNSYMLLLGYIEKHIELCLEQDCPMKYNKSRFATGKEEEEHSCKQLLKQIQRMFQYGIKKYPECTKLRLAFAFFYMEKYQNTGKAYEHFTRALKTEPSFGQQFIIYRFTKIISQKLQQNKQKNEQDLIELIRFDNHVTLCRQGMQISGKLHKEFWLELKEESPNLDRLNKIGAKIMETSEMVRENYGEVVRLSGDGLGIMELQYGYALYLLCICHEHEQGHKLIDLIKRKHELQKRKSNHISQKSKPSLSTPEPNSDKKCVLTISIEKQLNESITCRIVQVNRAFIELTRYGEAELVGKKFAKLMPKIYEEVHQGRIGAWLGRVEEEVEAHQRVGKDREKDKEKKEREKKEKENNEKRTHKQKNKEKESQKQQYVGSQQIGYIKDSSGYIKKVKYRVHFQPLQCQFIAQMKPLANEHAILCDTQGIIVQLSAALLYEIPQISSCLAIQDLTQIPLDQSFIYPSSTPQKTSLKKSFRNLPGNPKKYDLTLQPIQISTPPTQSPNHNHNSNPNQHGTNLNIDQLFKYSSDSMVQMLGIAVTVCEDRRLEKCMSFRSCYQDMCVTGFGDTRRTSMMGAVTRVIEGFYEEMAESSYKVNYNAKSRFHAAQQQPKDYQPKFTNYSIYYNSQQPPQAIKTFRYHKNSLTRIYPDTEQSQSSYNLQQKLYDLQSQLSQQKLQNPAYQASIKKALNTYIYHPEVKILYLCSLVGVVGFLLFLGLSYWEYQSRNVRGLGEQLERLRGDLGDLGVVGVGMLAAVFGDVEGMGGVGGRVIGFQPVVSVPDIQGFLLQDNSTTTISLTNALLRTQANLIRYLQQSPSPPSPSSPSSTLSTASLSYLTHLLPALSLSLPSPSPSNPTQAPTGLDLIILYFVCMVLLVGAFVVVWICYSLRIGFKGYGVLVWFLDVPLEYIQFAQNQCLYFARMYANEERYSETMPSLSTNHILELQQIQQYKKPNPTLSQPTYQPCSQPSSQPILNPSTSQPSSPQPQLTAESPQQKTESFKTRQQLISRYRKQSPFSLFSVRELLKFVVLGVMVCFMVGLVVVHFQGVAAVGRLEAVVGGYLVEYLWVTALPQIYKIQLDIHADPTLWQTHTRSLPQLQLQTTQALKTSQKQLKQLRQYILAKQQAAGGAGLGILEELTNFQYADLCALSEVELCGGLLGGRLRGGYAVVKEFVEGYRLDFGEPGTLVQIQQALILLTPLLFDTLTALITRTQQSITSTDFIISLTFYLYTILILTLFLLPWTFYLRKTNIKLNQTVQILNVIPMALIPVNRRETREFVRWVLMEANARGDEDGE